MRGTIQDLFKRSFDIITSILGLLLLTPLMFILALCIRIDSRGHVFYRGVRVGRFGKPFKVFKFRTMVVNAEMIGGPSTADDDPRITKVGSFLRRYKLDEVPQLLNVVKGEMSFVGPRPEVPMEVNEYNDLEKNILSVRPGITDWASLTFHNEGEILKGSMDPHKTYKEKIRPQKLKLALKYVEERSFLVDMKIILQTLLLLVKTRS